MEATAAAAVEASLSCSGELCISVVNERKCGAEPILLQRGAEDAEDVEMAEEDPGAAVDQRPAGNVDEFREHWQREVEDGGEGPIEGIRRLFEDDDGGGANVPMLGAEETTAVTTETDEDDDPIEDLWRLYSDCPVDDDEANRPVLDPAQEIEENAAGDGDGRQASPQRPRAASAAAASGRPRQNLPNDSGIDSSSPQSSNNSSVNPLEPRRDSEMSEGSEAPLMQSETASSNTLPRTRARRRADNLNDAAAHAKKQRVR